ncbi:response regulator transcription factor [Amycolatopsis keratiniphila]|uniref:response regulator transcription factor n=1 Tax=Amycolatopsis keratiniphila TaxID=129921 RepID=UPI0018D28058|nr:response regulator transcription factor [Amycolatopsis keratiniphila]
MRLSERAIAINEGIGARPGVAQTRLLHVRSILAKLGLANRTEIVAWASREGLKD